MALEVIILAAGKGKRMHSDLPKVLHKVANKPMLEHVIDSAKVLNPSAIHVVVGHMAQKVEQMVQSLDEATKALITISLQQEQLGTGHAVNCALDKVKDDSEVLVLYGDTPLTPVELLDDLVKSLQDKELCVLTANAQNPFGYGRIVRNAKGNLDCIVEEKDATDEQRKITEVNTGMLVARASVLKEYLPKLKNNNSQGEYYLTDLSGMLAKEGKDVLIKVAPDFEILSGVNSKPQLAFVERLYQRRAAQKLMENGVTLADPNRFDLRGTLTCGKDCFIDINCVFEGNVVLGDNVVIKAGCVIKDTSIGDDSVISPYSVFEDSIIKRKATIGPFARLRPGNVLEDEVHVGNFVECKKSHLGFGTKAGHLSYLGDAQIGRDVNIGAGTITCNYDGANKYKTVIGDDVFIGSDSQLVAPVEVKDGVTVAAGTTVTKRTVHSAKDLILTRAQTVIVEKYERPHKIKK